MLLLEFVIAFVLLVLFDLVSVEELVKEEFTSERISLPNVEEGPVVTEALNDHLDGDLVLHGWRGELLETTLILDE